MSETVEAQDIDAQRILHLAANLVEGGWTKGNMALDGMGDSIDPLDPRACAFCAHGALVAAANRIYPEMSREVLWEEVEIINEAVIELGLIPDTFEITGANAVVHQWNDEAYRMKIDVVETLHKAAQKIAAGAL
jgi:hypothetical protein